MCKGVLFDVKRVYFTFTRKNLFKWGLYICPSVCALRGYFGGTTPLTILVRSYGHSADILSMVWKCARHFDTIVLCFWRASSLKNIINTLNMINWLTVLVDCCHIVDRLPFIQPRSTISNTLKHPYLSE